MRLRRIESYIVVFVVALAVAGCSHRPFGHPPDAPAPEIVGPDVSMAPQDMPPGPSIPGQHVAPHIDTLDLVGRWGFAAYQRPEDTERTISLASKQCDKPYMIGQGPHGGVVMHLADSKMPEELALKSGPDGYVYVGPLGAPAGSKDRAITFFDGRILIMRYVDPETASRYGTAVYVRCGGPLVVDAPKPEPAVTPDAPFVNIPPLTPEEEAAEPHRTTKLKVAKVAKTKKPTAKKMAPKHKVVKPEAKGSGKDKVEVAPTADQKPKPAKKPAVKVKKVAPAKSSAVPAGTPPLPGAVPMTPPPASPPPQGMPSPASSH
jgi:hypothetical protein